MRVGWMLILLAAAGTVLGQTEAARPATNGAAGPAPLAASSPGAAAASKASAARDEQPLLLLDDEPSTNAPAGGADNSRCQVCHVNFMTEPLAATHARTNIGCATCHGACDAHIADESWGSGGNGTAPDIMFPRMKIYAACMSCHKPEQVFVKAEKHKPFWWSIAYQERVCTDCHGQHRMVTRRCRWK
jgi:hypothetical protein